MTDYEKPDGQKPDDEDGLALGWPEVDPTEEAETGVFVSDLELYRRLGVGPRTGRDAVRALESRGFPRKDPLFGNKRYWPAVRHFLDSLHGLAERAGMIIRSHMMGQKLFRSDDPPPSPPSRAELIHGPPAEYKAGHDLAIAKAGYGCTRATPS